MLLQWPCGPCLIVLLLVATSQQAGFISPDYVTSYGSGAYENLDVWYVGQTKEVVYDISDTGLEEYTIALWQQSVGGGGANPGPVVDSVALPLVSDSFKWVVALNGFDLDVSPVFFFWIFNGSSSNQGNTAFTDVSSAYFNISSDEPPTSSTSASTTAPSTSPTISSTTMSTNLAATSSIGSTVSMSTSTETSRGSEYPSTTAINGSVSLGSSSSGNGISTGAGVGIGVGLGLAGICAVVCSVIVVRGRKRKGKEQVHELPPYSSIGDNSLHIGPYKSHNGDPPVPGTLNPGHPVEMNAREVSPVELYAGPR